VITANIGIILLVTGAITAAMLAQFVAPLWVVGHVYGESPSDPPGIALARHWGLLLFCIGALLMYSAFHPPLRRPAVVVASLEKAGFVACVFGTSLRRQRIPALMAAADALMTLVYLLYLSGY
jgi:hypothetical protein